jgi:hypothetical protein
MAKQQKKAAAKEPERESLKVELEFTEMLLGTLPGDEKLAEEYVTSKHPDGVQDDEKTSLPEEIKKFSSYFARNDKGHPILWDYQIKGFFKDACSMMRRVVQVDELKAHKKIIDGLIFVFPREIPLMLSGELFFKERPLRITTPKGDRTALARSEAAPAGTKIQIEILLLKPDLKKYVINWFDYGILRGLGQWRNSGMGRFRWLQIK